VSALEPGIDEAIATIAGRLNGLGPDELSVLVEQLSDPTLRVLRACTAGEQEGRAKAERAGRR
jgi:hypothetical protein